LRAICPSRKFSGAAGRRAVLRLNFRSLKSDSPTLITALFVRFCADGTVRGPDNYVVARRVDGAWHISGKMHRELDCEGPLRLRVSAGRASSQLGPFRHVRASSGILYADETRLDVRLPGTETGASDELTMLSEEAASGKA
jgi:hypothetical protein